MKIYQYKLLYNSTKERIDVMSDRIIDFNEIKNKVKDKDVDKFEEYIYSMYSQLYNLKASVVCFGD